MSKLCSGIIRTIVTTALVMATSATQAQQAPVPSSNTQPPAVVVPTRTPTKQDLKLLSKAAGIFWQTDRSETESKLKLVFNGLRAGTTIDTTIEVKTIAKTGGKFRSQITFTPIRSTVKTTYIIVSNGTDVWIHRPDRNEYTKITIAEFGLNRVLIGSSSFAFLSIDEQNRQKLIASTGTDQDLIINLNPSESKQLQVETRQVDGVNLSIYSIDLKGYSGNVFLLPENANLQKIELSRKDPSLDLVTSSETIIKRNSQVNITDQTFTFVPPKGTKKVKSIKISLYDI